MCFGNNVHYNISFMNVFFYDIYETVLTTGYFDYTKQTSKRKNEMRISQYAYYYDEIFVIIQYSPVAEIKFKILLQNYKKDRIIYLFFQVDNAWRVNFYIGSRCISIRI